MKAEATGGGCKFGGHQADDLSTLTLAADSNADVKWALKFQ